MLAHTKVENMIINTVCEICFQNSQHHSKGFADKNKMIVKYFIISILSF